jgi:hypothetical protein
MTEKRTFEKDGYIYTVKREPDTDPDLSYLDRVSRRRAGDAGYSQAPRNGD